MMSDDIQQRGEADTPEVRDGRKWGRGTQHGVTAVEGQGRRGRGGGGHSRGSRQVRGGRKGREEGGKADTAGVHSR